MKSLFLSEVRALASPAFASIGASILMNVVIEMLGLGHSPIALILTGVITAVVFTELDVEQAD